MGLPYIETSTDRPTEAEATASHLVQMGIADAVISEDSDVCGLNRFLFSIKVIAGSLV